MNNKTIYTHDLLLKAKWVYTAKWRRNIFLFLILTSILGIGLIIADFLIENFYTLSAGEFFLICAFFLFLYLINNRKSKISDVISKQIQENPNRIMTYQFKDNYIIVNQTSDNVQSNTCINYSYIEKVVKIDKTSFYFTTKNSLCYVLYDENGIKELFAYVCSKT